MNKEIRQNKKPWAKNPLFFDYSQKSLFTALFTSCWDESPSLSQSLNKQFQKPNPRFMELEKNQGFTLIEVLVSAALLVILASAFVGLQYILSQNQVSAWRNYQSIEAANNATNSIAKELRNAQNSEVGSYSLVTAEDQSIVFYSDYDFDGIVERIRYTLTNSDLVRGVVEPTGSPYTYNTANESVKTVTDIVRNGTTPLFYYYNEDWPTDTTNNPISFANRIAQTREIKIHLETNPKSEDQVHNFTIDTTVKIRMFN